MAFGRNNGNRQEKFFEGLEEDNLDVFFQDEVDGVDEMFLKKLYYLNCSKSIVFNPETFLPDILDHYKDVMDRMTTLTEDKGVVKKIIRPGNGTSPAPDVEIVIHYNGFLEGGDEPFDASTMRRNHQIFKLADFAFFPGMQLAVESMQYNEVAQFIFTPTYFFGKMGCPPKIPPGISSMFFIELLDIKNMAEKKVYERNFEELQSLSCEEIMREVAKLKEDGNVKYKSDLYEDAITRYTMGLDILDNYLFASAGEDIMKNSMKLKLMANLAQCYMLTKNNKKAIQVCKLALSPGMPKHKNAKLHFRYARLLILKDDLAEAGKIIREGMTIEPNNQALHSLANQVKWKLDKERKATLQSAMAMSRGLFSKDNPDDNIQNQM